MNKLESLNEGGQTSTTKAFQVDQPDVIEESAIGAMKNIRGITNGIFTTNQLKEQTRWKAQFNPHIRMRSHTPKESTC